MLHMNWNKSVNTTHAHPLHTDTSATHTHNNASLRTKRLEAHRTVNDLLLEESKCTQLYIIFLNKFDTLKGQNNVCHTLECVLKIEFDLRFDFHWQS